MDDDTRVAAAVRTAEAFEVTVLGLVAAPQNGGVPAGARDRWLTALQRTRAAETALSSALVVGVADGDLRPAERTAHLRRTLGV
jgi:tellurite resistance protein